MGSSISWRREDTKKSPKDFSLESLDSSLIVGLKEMCCSSPFTTLSADSYWALSIVCPSFCHPRWVRHMSSSLRELTVQGKMSKQGIEIRGKKRHSGVEGQWAQILEAIKDPEQLFKNQWCQGLPHTIWIKICRGQTWESLWEPCGWCEGAAGMEMWYQSNKHRRPPGPWRSSRPHLKDSEGRVGSDRESENVSRSQSGKGRWRQ